MVHDGRRAEGGTAPIIGVMLLLLTVMTVSGMLFLRMGTERTHDPRFNWKDMPAYDADDEAFYYRVTIAQVYGADRTRPLTLHYGDLVFELGSVPPGTSVDLNCPSKPTSLTVSSPTRAESTRTVKPCPEAPNTPMFDPGDPEGDYDPPGSNAGSDSCAPLNPTQKIGSSGFPSATVCMPDNG